MTRETIIRDLETARTLESQFRMPYAPPEVMFNGIQFTPEKVRHLIRVLESKLSNGDYD